MVKKTGINATVGEVRELLDNKGLRGKYRLDRMPDDRGNVLSLEENSLFGTLIINCFDTGKVNVQGKGSKTALEGALKDYLGKS